MKHTRNQLPKTNLDEGNGAPFPAAVSVLRLVPSPLCHIVAKVSLAAKELADYNGDAGKTRILVGNNISPG